MMKMDEGSTQRSEKDDSQVVITCEESENSQPNGQNDSNPSPATNASALGDAQERLVKLEAHRQKQTLYPVAGHDVAFPHQPYGVQLQFMDCLIRTVECSSNALLEAPTGCGKTLSLLCGALAWQSKSKSQIADQVQTMPITHLGVQDFQAASEHPGHTHTVPASLEEGWMGPPFPDEQLKVPKIYYCTRTHSQIAQVVSELKKTSYRPKMAILGSRTHYCINDKVRAGDVHVDEACEGLRDAKACKHDRGTPAFVAYAVRSHAVKVHDIEDLQRACRGRGGCPFYVSRELMQDAEVVFCPYNYLIDPVIRSAMSINVSGAVLIFDEAHNIEDVAREAASCDVRLSDLVNAEKDAASAAGDAESELAILFVPFHATTKRLIAWVHKTASDHQICKSTGYDLFEAIWSGGQIRQMLEQAGLDPCTVKALIRAMDDIKQLQQNEREANEEQATSKVGIVVLSVWGRLLAVLTLMYQHCEQLTGPDNASDFRLVVRKTVERNQSRGKGRQFRGFHDDGRGDPASQIELCVWCLNPGCVFQTLGQQARSVVVTSGTLSPMTSFQSELGIPFAYRLEAPHVVSKDQVLPMCIAQDPRGGAIKAVYRNTSTLDFQDGVGQSLLHLAAAVPDGLLVFMPSYGLMNMLTQRWKATGLWKQLLAAKPVWVEPHSAGELDETIQDYQAAIAEGRGAMYIAVCRGKVSEGINFSDANARAVVVLGIPYPAAKDTKVVLKKSYNNACRARGLISGDDWYTLQAFRAMNQALGRCIRHKNDFGAIILLDERLRVPNNQVGLSKWLRSDIRRPASFLDAERQLGAFYERCRAPVTLQRGGSSGTAGRVPDSGIKKVQLQIKREDARCGDKQASIMDMLHRRAAQEVVKAVSTECSAGPCCTDRSAQSRPCSVEQKCQHTDQTGTQELVYAPSNFPEPRGDGHGELSVGGMPATAGRPVPEDGQATNTLVASGHVQASCQQGRAQKAHSQAQAHCPCARATVTAAPPAAQSAGSGPTSEFCEGSVLESPLGCGTGPVRDALCEPAQQAALALDSVGNAGSRGQHSGQRLGHAEVTLHAADRALLDSDWMDDESVGTPQGTPGGAPHEDPAEVQATLRRNQRGAAEVQQSAQATVMQCLQHLSTHSYSWVDQDMRQLYQLLQQNGALSAVTEEDPLREVRATLVDAVAAAWQEYDRASIPGLDEWNASQAMSPRGVLWLAQQLTVLRTNSEWPSQASAYLFEQTFECYKFHLGFLSQL